MRLFALVLAGGRGSRLGDVRKGALRIGGQRLIDRVADRLAGAVLLVSTGPGNGQDLGRGVSVPDSEADFAGPMAGIAAGLAYLEGRADEGDLLLTVAVDTPFLPEDFCARMKEALDGGANAGLAAWGEAFYPTNAIYRFGPLREQLAESEPDSPKRLLAAMGAVAVDWGPLAAEDPFVNLNTLTDLVALGRRAMAGKK